MLAIIALLFSLASCEEKLPDRSDTGLTEEKLPDRSDAGLTEEELSIYEIADKALADKFSVKNLSAFKVSLCHLNDGRIEVSYELELFGILTNENYSVYLNGGHKVVDIYSNDVGVYSRLVNDKGFKSSLDAAKEDIKKQAENHGVDFRGDFFYYTVVEGFICLNHEIIVDIIPPRVDEEGNSDGCGRDHDHILLTEQLCPVS